MSMVNEQTLILTAQQVRVLGCLMEKELATPNSYPLTFNSLTLACNQKTNRDPVMTLTEGQVGHTVGELADLDIARVSYGDRANKVTHRAPSVLKLTREQQAVLAMLMLRAPLTLADIKARTERMVQFTNLDGVADTVDELINRDQPLAVLIPKGQGRREIRYTHLLAGEPDLDLVMVDAAPQAASHTAAKTDKLAQLEARIERLEQQLGITIEPEAQQDD